jgi:hypothetical protein
MGLQDENETGVENRLAGRDTVFKGRNFLRMLLNRGNCVIAASGMVRRDCYDRLGAFPLDLPYAGDWYLWCLFAIHYDIAYFQEAMVNYRHHDLSMTTHLTGERFVVRFKDGLAVLWRIRQKALEIGRKDVAKLCISRIAYQYGHNIMGRVSEGSTYRMNHDLVRESISENTKSAQEIRQIWAETWQIVGDCNFRARNFDEARKAFRLAQKYNKSDLKSWAKLLLVRLNIADASLIFRDKLLSFRQRLATARTN